MKRVQNLPLCDLSPDNHLTNLNMIFEWCRSDATRFVHFSSL